MLVSVGLYSERFEELFIADSKRFFLAEGQVREGGREGGREREGEGTFCLSHSSTFLPFFLHFFSNFFSFTLYFPFYLFSSLF